MYTEEIGRQFLKLYNQKTGKNYSALEFFEEEFFPVVFDSEDYLHLMQVTNSPFFQGLSKSEKDNDLRKSINRKNRFLNKIKDVVEGKKEISGSIAVGYMAGDVTKGTSGQISSIDLNLSEEKILYTWFGGALGVGFGEGKDFLFQNEELLWFIFQGWKYYRQYINETNKAKGRQIETWNGLWIRYGLEFSEDLDRAYKEVVSALSNHFGTDRGLIKLERPKWISQIFIISKYLRENKIKEIVYGYSYGKTNETLGFMYIELDKVGSMADLFDQLIQTDSEIGISERISLEKIYETHFSLVNAFTKGGIGIQAIMPKNLNKHTIWTDNKRVKSLPNLDKKENRITFFTYITWVQAMLKNEDTLKLAEEVAEALIKYEKGQERLTKRENEVTELWESYSRQQLIDNLAAIVEKEPDVAEIINKAVDQLMTKIPQDMYRLFLTLVKFKYHYYQSN